MDLFHVCKRKKQAIDAAIEEKENACKIEMKKWIGLKYISFKLNLLQAIQNLFGELKEEVMRRIKSRLENDFEGVMKPFFFQCLLILLEKDVFLQMRKSDERLMKKLKPYAVKFFADYTNMQLNLNFDILYIPETSVGRFILHNKKNHVMVTGDIIEKAEKTFDHFVFLLNKSIISGAHLLSKKYYLNSFQEILLCKESVIDLDRISQSAQSFSSLGFLGDNDKKLKFDSSTKLSDKRFSKLIGDEKLSDLPTQLIEESGKYPKSSSNDPYEFGRKSLIDSNGLTKMSFRNTSSLSSADARLKENKALFESKSEEFSGPLSISSGMFKTKESVVTIGKKYLKSPSDDYATDFMQYKSHQNLSKEDSPKFEMKTMMTFPSPHRRSSSITDLFRPVNPGWLGFGAVEFPRFNKNIESFVQHQSKPVPWCIHENVHQESIFKDETVPLFTGESIIDKMIKNRRKSNLMEEHTVSKLNSRSALEAIEKEIYNEINLTDGTFNEKNNQNILKKQKSGRVKGVKIGFQIADKSSDESQLSNVYEYQQLNPRLTSLYKEGDVFKPERNFTKSSSPTTKLQNLLRTIAKNTETKKEPSPKQLGAWFSSESFSNPYIEEQVRYLSFDENRKNSLSTKEQRCSLKGRNRFSKRIEDKRKSEQLGRIEKRCSFRKSENNPIISGHRRRKKLPELVENFTEKKIPFFESMRDEKINFFRKSFLHDRSYTTIIENELDLINKNESNITLRSNKNILNKTKRQVVKDLHKNKMSISDVKHVTNNSPTDDLKSSIPSHPFNITEEEGTDSANSENAETAEKLRKHSSDFKRKFRSRTLDMYFSNLGDDMKWSKMRRSGKISITKQGEIDPRERV